MRKPVPTGHIAKAQDKASGPRPSSDRMWGGHDQDSKLLSCSQLTAKAGLSWARTRGVPGTLLALHSDQREAGVCPDQDPPAFLLTLLWPPSCAKACGQWGGLNRTTSDQSWFCSFLLGRLVQRHSAGATQLA